MSITIPTPAVFAAVFTAPAFTVTLKVTPVTDTWRGVTRTVGHVVYDGVQGHAVLVTASGETVRVWRGESWTFDGKPAGGFVTYDDEEGDRYYGEQSLRISWDALHKGVAVTIGATRFDDGHVAWRGTEAVKAVREARSEAARVRASRPLTSSIADRVKNA